MALGFGGNGLSLAPKGEKNRIIYLFRGYATQFAIEPFSTRDIWSQTLRYGQDQFRPLNRAARTIKALTRRSFSSLLFALLMLLALGPARMQAQTADPDFLEALLDDPSNVMVVLDASGTMGAEWAEGVSKYEAARRALRGATSGLPKETRTGAIAFGHRRNFDCTDIEVLINPTASALALNRTLRDAAPQERGMRPLAYALETAAARLSQQTGGGTIVLMTDGADDCGGNVCALSAPLEKMQMAVHVIGLGLNVEQAEALRCLPESAGGSMSLLAGGQDLAPELAKALALSHTANAQRLAAGIARLLLQEQDMAVSELNRIREDMTRLDEALTALDARVDGFASRQLLTEQLQPAGGRAIDDEVALIREAATRLKDQLGSRDQMLIRMQDKTDRWNAGTLGLRRQADLAAQMAERSEAVEEPAAKLMEGHKRLVERRATLEMEMSTTAAQSAELHGRLNALETALESVTSRVSSAKQLAQSIESGQPITVPTDQLDPGDQAVLSAIEDRDALIASLEAERSTLQLEVKAARADLVRAQEDMLRVQRQNADANRAVDEARDVVASLQANQISIRAEWQADLDEISQEHRRVRDELETRLSSVLLDAEVLRADLLSVRQSLAQSEADRSDLVVARDRAREQASLSDAEAGRLRIENASRSGDLAKCEIDKGDLRALITDLEGQLASAGERLLVAQDIARRQALTSDTELSRLRTENATLDASLLKSEQENSALNTFIGGLEQDLKTTGVQLISAKEQAVSQAQASDSTVNLLRDENAQLAAEMTECTLGQRQLRDAIAGLQQDVRASEAQLAAAQPQAATDAAAGTATAARLRDQVASLSDILNQCRVAQGALNTQIAALEEDLEAARAIAAKWEPSSVTFALAPGAGLDAALPLWSVEDAATNALLSEGEGERLNLPRDPGLYRVIVDLGGQLLERSFAVKPFERADYEFPLDLAKLDLSLSVTKASEGVTRPVLVALTSPIYAQQIDVTPGRVTSLIVPAGRYQIEADLGLTRWQAMLDLAAGSSATQVIDVNTLPVSLNLVAGAAGAPIDPDLAWTLSDARNPGQRTLSLTGARAELSLEPGVYDVEVAFEGFVASQSVFIDATDQVDRALVETVRFDDGAVRLAFANNGEAVPDGLDLQWRIEMEGAAIVTSQTLDGDTVQLPSGQYRLQATANGVPLSQDFVITAGQVTELAPEFMLGQVTLQLLTQAGTLSTAGAVDWTVTPQGAASAASGFSGAERTGAALQRMLLPEGRYRVRAVSPIGTVERLISVRSGDKASFGLQLLGQGNG